MLQYEQLAQLAMERDSKNLALDKQARCAFIIRNSIQYELALETWYFVLRFGSVTKVLTTDSQNSEIIVDETFDIGRLTTNSDFSHFFEEGFETCILTYGLIGSITHAKNVCNELHITPNVARLGVFEFLSPIVCELKARDVSAQLILIELLTRLSFLDRFTISCDTYRDDALSSFLDTDIFVSDQITSRLEEYWAPYTKGQYLHGVMPLYSASDRSRSCIKPMEYHGSKHAGSYYMYSNYIRYAFTSFFQGFNYHKPTALEAFRYGCASGAVNSVPESYSGKDKYAIKALSQTKLGRLALVAKQGLFQIWDMSGLLNLEDFSLLESKPYVLWDSVPKSATKYRSIAVNSADHVFEQKILVEQVYQYLRDTDMAFKLTIPTKRSEVTIDLASQLHTIGSRLQNHNQLQLCDRFVATIDSTAASDTVTMLQVKELLGDHFYDLFNRVRLGRVKLPSGQNLNMSKAFTMGDPACFLVETLVFWIIGVLSSYVYCLFNPQTIQKTKQIFSAISAYGDDLEVHEDVFCTALDFMEHYGFIPNVEKSFKGIYRESCGVECFSNTLFKGVKWPRHEFAASMNSINDDLIRVTPNDSTYVDLINLQHKMFKVPGFSSLIRRCLLERDYEICYSRPTTSHLVLFAASDYDLNFWTENQTLIDSMSDCTERQYRFNDRVITQRYNYTTCYGMATQPMRYFTTPNTHSFEYVLDCVEEAFRHHFSLIGEHEKSILNTQDSPTESVFGRYDKVPTRVHLVRRRDTL